MTDRAFAGMSYDAVLQKYADTVAGVCVMRLQNWADAEDCFQNTFLKLFQKSPEFHSEAHLKAWLIRVAINECRNYISKNRRFLPLDGLEQGAVSFHEDERDISWALMRLEPKFREVVYLHYCEQYKVAEIADILSLNENTVKTLLHRGRKRLKSIYGGDGR